MVHQDGIWFGRDDDEVVAGGGFEVKDHGGGSCGG